MKDDSLSDVVSITNEREYCCACRRHSSLHPYDLCGIFVPTDTANNKEVWAGCELTGYDVRSWNAAIEAAAKCVEQANKDGPYQAIVAHREIRKLKK